MFGNLITLVIIPQKTSRVIRLRIPMVFIKSFSLLIFLFAAISGYILYDYTDIKGQVKEYKDLQESIMLQKIEMKKIVNNLQFYWDDLDTYEEFDRKLRVIVGVKESTPPNIFAIGGGESDQDLFTSDENESQAERRHILNQLKKLDFRVQQRERSYFQLETYLQDRKDRLARTPSISPVKGYITSGYGMRHDPITGQLRMHTAIDWANREFTPIYAPADGVVTATFVNRGYGNFLVVDHGYGITTRYAHLSKYEVKVGQKIKRGSLIARLGNSGRSTGPHLHYEVLVRDKKVNPTHYILE